MSLEMLEIYNFEEIDEFSLNRHTFHSELKKWYANSWPTLNETERRYFCNNLFEKFDMCDSEARINSLRCLLYLVQGCSVPMPGIYSNDEIREIQKSNAILLYQMDVLTIIVQQLNFNTKRCGAKYKKMDLSKSDNVELRLVLTILYLIMEVFNLAKEFNDSVYKSLVDDFTNEISNPLFDDELLSTKLWIMIDDFVKRGCCHYPLKKIILLLLKVTVVSLGGFQEIDILKNKYRKTYGLKETNSSTDSDKFILKCKQGNEFKATFCTRKSYPNVAHKFLKKAVKKYCKYDQNSSINIHNVYYNNLYGMPKPIEEIFQVLRKNVYISLADVHRQQEQHFVSHPLTQSYTNQNCRTEILYSHLVMRLNSYFTSLLKILFKCMNINRDHEENATFERYEVLRREDIIIYSILIIILLYLKHFKINNVHQFEYLSQIIYNQQFILATTNFFNMTNIRKYVCGIPYKRKFYFDNQLMSSKRRMTIVLTILQIVSKLTKWKPYRITKLIECLSVNTYQRLLNEIKNSVIEYHLLKLIKIQIKFLGKQWKNSHLKLISDIFLRLNLFLNDDYNITKRKKIDDGNETSEYMLKHRVQKFNQEHYLGVPSNLEASHQIFDQKLNEDFKRNYEVWLQDHVYNNNFEWDQLMLTVED